MISIKGEGTFSEVLKCKNKNDGTYWACKKMKKYYHRYDSINNKYSLNFYLYLMLFKVPSK
jgi:renal tumor antigen